MSAREWKPGDVAMVTARWIRTDDHSERYAVRRVTGWWSRAGVNVGDHEVSDIRPLVVVDAEDREQVERLSGAYLAAVRDNMPADNLTHMQAALSEFADPTPPKPDEPTGRYAAVQTAEGLEYVRLGDGPKPWMHNGSPQNSDTYAWSDIAAVRVLSEGVTP